MRRWNSIEDRIESKSVFVPISGCRIWVGCLTGPTNSRYGTIFHNGKQKRVHRVVWELTHGVIPDGMFVCHTCDVPTCININHLFLGTPKENTVDMVTKGRAKGSAPRGDRNPARLNPSIVRGERSGKAKLKKGDVERIFALRDQGMTQLQIATAFGIARSHVSRILLKKAGLYI